MRKFVFLSALVSVLCLVGCTVNGPELSGTQPTTPAIVATTTVATKPADPTFTTSSTTTEKTPDDVTPGVTTTEKTPDDVTPGVTTTEEKGLGCPL